VELPDRRYSIKFPVHPDIKGAPLLGEHTDEVLADWDTTRTPSPFHKNKVVV
jgi:crotonobetainyl-CoA:carnitine CoA-transferase CaiB-like acyl-CoA transferase